MWGFLKHMSKLMINLSREEADIAILQSKNPVTALLYIYGLVNGGIIDTEKAQAELLIDEFSLNRATDTLLAFAVCSVANESGVSAALDNNDINNLRKTDFGFRGICGIYEKTAGRFANQNEINSLYNIYINLNMSPDMITLLITSLKERDRFSLRNLEKTAYEWHDANINTYEAAEQYMNEKFAQGNRYRDILKVLNITGRDPVASEKKFLDTWIEKKIPLQLISLAYEKTIYNISELRWPYINKILMNWSDAGYKTVDDVNKNESSHQRTGSSSPDKTQKTNQTILLEEYTKKRRDREQKAADLISRLTAASADFVDNERHIKLVSRKMAGAAMSGGDISIFRDQLDDLNRKRARIISANGYKVEEVFPVPDCPLCNDHGFIGSNMCKCFKEKLEKM